MKVTEKEEQELEKLKVIELVKYSFNAKRYKKEGVEYLKTLSNSFYYETSFWTTNGVEDKHLKHLYQKCGEFVQFSITELIPEFNGNTTAN